VGIHENWTLEFFPILARMFPEASFISYIRDPRATLHSSEIDEKDANKHPAVLSMARHIRKHLTLTLHLAHMPIMKNRFMVTKYEDFIQDLDSYNAKIVEFLGLEPSTYLSIYKNFRDGSGQLLPNSFQVYKNAAENWKLNCQPKLEETSTFINQHEMLKFGYETKCSVKNLNNSTREFLKSNMQSATGWKEFEVEVDRQIDFEVSRNLKLNKRQLLSEYAVTNYFWTQSHYDLLLDPLKGSLVR
jgi:hypothetical protein